MEENLQSIYDKLASLGSKGSYSQFVDYFNASDENKRAVYDKLAANGSKGSYEQFLEYAGVGQQQPAPRVDVSDVEAQQHPQVTAMESPANGTEQAALPTQQTEQQPMQPISDNRDRSLLQKWGDRRQQRKQEEEARKQSELAENIAKYEVPTEFSQDNYDAVAKRVTDLQKRQDELGKRGQAYGQMGFGAPKDILEASAKEAKEINKELDVLMKYQYDFLRSPEGQAYLDGYDEMCDQMDAAIKEAGGDKYSWQGRLGEAFANTSPTDIKALTPEEEQRQKDMAEYGNKLIKAKRDVKNVRREVRMTRERLNGDYKGFRRGWRATDVEGLSRINDFADTMTQLELAKKVREGKPLDKVDEVLLRANELKAASDMNLATSDTMWENIGSSAADQMVTTFEFVLGSAATGSTALAGNVSKNVMASMGRKAAKDAVVSEARNLLRAGTAELAGMAAGAAVQTFANPLSYLSMMTDYAEKRTGTIYYDENDGQLHYFDNDKSIALSLWQAAAGAYIENFTEFSGEGLDKIGKVGLNKLFAAAPELKAATETISELLDKVKFSELSGLSAPAMDDFLRHAGFNGTLGEFGEEVLGNIIRPFAYVETEKGESYGKQLGRGLKNLVDVDQNLETFLSCAITSAVLGTVGTVRRTASDMITNSQQKAYDEQLLKDVRYNIAKLDAMMNGVRGLDKEAFKEFVANNNVADISQYIKEQAKANNWTSDELGMVALYVTNVAQQNAMANQNSEAIQQSVDALNEQTKQLVNEWDGEHIYNVTFKDPKTGEELHGAVVNGRMHYTQNDDGTYNFNPYVSSAMLAIRMEDGSVRQVSSRAVTSLDNVTTAAEQNANQGQIVRGMMEKQFEKDELMPTVESAWGFEFEPGATEIDGLTFVGKDKDGNYQFQMGSNANRVVKMSEEQVISWGLRQGISLMQGQAANEQMLNDISADVQRMSDDADLMDEIDQLKQQNTRGVTAHDLWKQVIDVTSKFVSIDENGLYDEDNTSPNDAAVDLYARAEGNVAAAKENVAKAKAALMSASEQGSLAAVGAFTGSALANQEARVQSEEATTRAAKQIAFLEQVDKVLDQMGARAQQLAENDAKEKAKMEAAKPVSQMQRGNSFPVMFNGQEATAIVREQNTDGNGGVLVDIMDANGEPIPGGAGYIATADELERMRVQPQMPTAPEQVPPQAPPQAPEQVEPQQEVPQAHPLDDFIARHGENAENKLGVTIDAINKEIASLAKDLEKAEKDLANMPEPYDDKTQKAQDKQEEKIAKLRAELDEKRNILAPYAAMQEELDRRKEVRQSRENGVTDALVKFTERLNNMLHPKRESKQDMEPQTIEEFIASRLRRKGLARTAVKTINKKTKKMVNGWKYTNPVESFDYDSFKQETGLSDSEMKNFNDPIQPFFTKEGGITFGEFVHSIWEDRGEPGVREDISDSEVRDAVIEFFRSGVSSLKDINDYIEKHRRDEQAEQEAIANDMIAQHNGYESGEAMENDLIAQASARADELLGSDTLSDDDVAAFDAELSQRLDNLVPSVEETEPATQETTVENTEDEDFIQPTDEEAPFSVTGKSNEQIASEYQKQLDEAKTESDRAKVIQEYLDTIGTEPAVVMTEDTFIALLLENKIPIDDIRDIRDALADCKTNNLKFNAFKYNGKVYMFSEYQDTIDDARTNYVHERQHIFTGGTKKGLSLRDKIKGLASEKELERYVELLSGSDFYTRLYGGTPQAHKVYADEFISMAMERAYNGMDLDAELGKLGIKQELINEIKQLDNEQRTDESLAKARRTSPVNESRQGDNGQNGGNQKRESRKVGGQRSVTVQRGEQTAERRESVKSGEIGNEQRKSDGLAKARRGGGRNLHVDNNAERGSGHDGQNQGRRPGEVEEQGLRPSYRGNEETGSGEVSGILPIDKQTPKNTTIDEVLYSIKVNHNSPYLLKKADGSFIDPETGERLGFDHRFMSNGEGAQAHGWGSYFSVNDLRSYAGQVKNDIYYQGKLYDVNEVNNHISEVGQRALNWFLYGVEPDKYTNDKDGMLSIIDKAINSYEVLWSGEKDDYYNRQIEQFKDMRKFVEDHGDEIRIEPQRHHYNVEIPDNNGTNYFEESEPLKPEQIAMLQKQSDKENAKVEIGGFLFYANPNKNPNAEKYTFRNFLSDITSPQGGITQKQASEFFSRAGFVGTHYDGKRDGECYVIFDENDAKIVDHVRFSVREKNNSEHLYSVTSQSSEEEKEETYFNGEPRFSVVADRSLLLELERNPKVKVYRAMQMRDGKIYPPMAGKVNGEWQNPIELGVWEQADEHPELVDENGKFKLDKGNGKYIKAAYNPYLHTSRSPLNDQFSSAWDRPELVTVEVEVPESELTSGYKAEKAKNAVGEVEWKSGPVSGKLAKKGNPRKVILSRYDKPIRIVPAEEVAERIADMLEGTGLSIPFNTVTPELRDALVAQGVQIGKPQKGNAGNASMDTYNDWKEAEDLRFSTNGTHVISNGKSLVGIHNIGAEKLRKAMKNGGFANPSAAVIDIDKQEHKGYGEVSLIMPSSLVDSRTGRNAGTYAGDAYTPEYPSVSYREGKNTDKLVKDLVKDLPKELGWAIRQGIGEYMDGNRSRSGLEYLFLKEKGQEMPIVKNERRYPDISMEQIGKRLGVEESDTRGHSGELYAAYEKLEGDDLVDFNMWFEAYGDDEKINQRKDLMERNAKVKELLTEQFGEHMGYGKFDTTWYNVFRDERDAGNENIPRTLEDAAMKIDELGLRNEFEDWKQKTIDGLGYEEVIFDGYTPSGYRRYVPNTVENASRIMNKKEKTNWLSDAGTHATKAMLLDKFNTLNDIRKNRGLLESDQEVINQAYEEASDAWSELGSELSDMQKVDDNRFINHDIALNRLQEAMMKSNPAAYLNKEYKYNLDEEFNDRIKEVKQQIKSLPSKYFETKFRRPVYLNEFAAAVVPNDLPQDLKERLQQSGLPLFEYDPNKEGDRRAVTLEATEGDGIRFSVANRNQAIFVSNAARAVEGIKQEKATPEQWLKMIEKNGGLKAGEDKWLGLSQWLKDQANTDAPRSDESLTEWAERNRKKTLTKQEVLDFINENAIKIEETHYGNRLSADSEAMQPWQEEFREEIENAEMLYDDADNRLQEFYTEMEDKYGADYLDQMDEDELAMEERLLQEREDVNTDYRPAYQIAFDAMVDDHGDDFGLAFYPTPNGLQISDEDAASYFLGGNQINSVRMQYTTEGLDNKREIALTVPTIEPWNKSDEIHFGDAGGGRAVAWIRFGETTTEREYTEQEKADRLEQMPKSDQWERVDKKDTGFANPKWNAYYAPGTRGKAGNNYIIEGDDGVFEISGTGQIRNATLSNTRFYSLEDAVNALNKALANARGTKEIQRVLVIDEIQSKRHQEGREKGYKTKESEDAFRKLSEARSLSYIAYQEYDNYSTKLFKEYGPGFPNATDTELEQYNYLKDRYHNARQAEKEADELFAPYQELYNQHAVPDAPFEKNWMELAMKRMLRLAAEEGYDKVAWTTGEQQAERYNLGKFYDTIGREDRNDDYRRYVLSGNNVDEIVIDEQNRVVESSVSEAEGKPLSEVVGMDMAVKMENMNDGDELSGNELRIGGEGMKGFYDKMIPSFMNKYGKQWGVKVGEVTMPNLEEGYQTMHSIDVNEQMKADVMEGQVMFSVTAQQDKDYMDAVNRGDMETAQRMVLEAAKAAMPNTKVVDENGNPLVVYHGTAKDFYIFGIEHLGETSGNEGWFGPGFYFTQWKESARGYAGWAKTQHGGEERIIPCFINIKNPQVVDATQGNFVLDKNADGVIATINIPKDNPYSRNGQRYSNGELYYEVKANNSSQIKSADPVTYDDQGNVIPLSERFNPNNNDIRFSVNGQQRIAVADEFNRRTGANMEDVGTYTRIKESLIRDWFDGLHPLEQAQKLIEEKLGRKLRDSEKAYELATQTTSVSAAMIDEEEKKHIIPILNKATELIRKMMNNDRLSREEAYRRLSNYMLAKHGLERNKWFHEQALLTDPNAEEEDKSGLTGLAAMLGENPDEYKAVAERIVKEFEDEYDSQEIDDYWNEMRGLTNRLLEISYESGMIDKDTYDNLKKRHKFYVPLRGFGEGTIGDIFDYIGQMPHFQETLKKAKGRKSVAGDPLANLYNMLQSAIVIGNQNKVMQKLYNLAVNSNNDLLRLKKTWYVYDDVEDRWEERYPDIPKDATDAEIDAIVKKFDADMQAAKANGKAKTKLNKLDLAKKVLPYQAKQHEMVAYIDGKKVILQVVGNPVLAQALNKANQQQLGIFAETMQGITRFMSMINTSLSPAFMLTNSARDIGFALFSAMVTGGFKKTGQMAAWMATSGWVIPRLMITGKLDAGLVKALGKQNAAQIEQWWNEFTQNGGETGFTRTLSAEKARGQVDDMIRHILNGSKDGESRLRKSTVGLVESAGRWSEDISRFAAYCWSRAQGNSVMESVNEAKNVTVNFNVKGGGRLAAACRAVYSFFNAALQGIGRMARLAKENPKAYAACLTACMLQGAVLPWLNMVMFGLLGGDDDDWEKYKMLTEYTANKNLVLYVGDLNPFKKTQGKFIKIPYSQELAPFAAMGNIFFRQQMGWNKGESVASQVGKMFLDLAPVSIGESKTFMGKAIKTATPTALMPFVELWMNEDFTGSPIQKDNQWNKYARGWERAYEGKTSKWLVDASKWLDDKTGIDISPAVAEHMFSGVLGGIGRSGDKLLRYFSNGFQLQDAPFIRTLMFDSKQQGYVGAVQREYGRNAYDVLDKVKHDVENMDAIEFARFSQTEEFEIANLVSIYKTGKDIAGNKKDVVGIDAMEKEYKKIAGASDGSEEYREQLEEIRSAITERKMELLDEIQQIKYEHANDLRKRIIDRVNEVERESKEKNARRNG